LLCQHDERKLKAELDLLYKRYKEVLEATNLEWLSTRKKDAENSPDNRLWLPMISSPWAT